MISNIKKIISNLINIINYISNNFFIEGAPIVNDLSKLSLSVNNLYFAQDKLKDEYNEILSTGNQISLITKKEIQKIKRTR